MLFHSYQFIFIFLPVVIVVFALLQRLQTGGKGALPTPYTNLGIIWLVLCSLFFYGWWNPAYVLLLIASIGINFIIGHYLTRNPSKAILGIGVLFNLGLLGYYKYAGFFASVVGINMPDIILPLAISFFTFQQIAYLVDTYRGEINDNNFARYCLFVTFFPQLIAGPILRHSDIVPQIKDRKIFGVGMHNIAIGLTFFAIGLFKKTVIADTMGTYANPVFNMADQGGNITIQDAWIGTFAYSFQLYFDFSAYSDMAMGLARMFGIQIPLNFFSPYKSTSIVDFWRRWHMTLSRFLRDYLYIPLGGNKRGKIRRYSSIVITMLLGGLWHGAAWNFVIWGAIHGLFIVINHQWKGLCKQHKIAPFRSVAGQIAAITLTFICVTFSWIFFRAQTWDGAITIIHAMTGNYFNKQGGTYDISHIPDLFSVTFMTTAIFAGVVLLTFFAPNAAQFMRRTLRAPASGEFAILNREKLVSLVQKAMPVWRLNIWYALTIAAIFTAGLLSITKNSPFLYFQF